MRAVITGAGGFVGPHLASHLRDCGDETVELDVETGPDLLDGPGWISAIAAAQPDAIYHLAGLSDVGGSWQNPRRTFEVNTIGTVSVLEAARQAGTAKVLVISSADVYGTVTPDELPLTEEHAVKPRSPYGASKQAAEAAAVQYWRGHGLATVIARPFNHLGSGQSDRFIAPALAGQIAVAEAGGTSTVRHGDLTPERDLTDVRDVVRAYRLLIEHGENGQVYNVCQDRTVSMQALLDALVALSDVQIDSEVDPSRLRPVELPALRGSFAKLQMATGWEPKISLEETLADVLEDARRRVRAATPTTAEQDR